MTIALVKAVAVACGTGLARVFYTVHMDRAPRRAAFAESR